MFPGYAQTDFMTALRLWDECNKKVRCLYRQTLHEFDTNTEWRSSFTVHAGLILEGIWYVEE